MKHLLSLLLFFLCSNYSFAQYDAEVKSLLITLDSMISRKEVYAQNREYKIEQLLKQKSSVRNLEEAYWLNKMLYDEYFFFNADSASLYVDRNKKIATQLNNKEWLIEWKIKKSFILSATGLLKEAFDELEDISGQSLNMELKGDYYGQMIYLFSHFVQYSGDGNNMRDEYYKKEQLYKDSIYTVLSPKDPSFLWYKGWKFLGLDNTESIKKDLAQKLVSSKMDSRWDAMNAYILARLYQEDNQQSEYLKYMITSAIVDVRIANKDIASLEELAQTMFSLGDIDRAYSYINYCLQSALLYPNRVRVVSISARQDAIHTAYQKKSMIQESRLHWSLIIVSILLAILLTAILYIYRQMKHLSYSRSKLNETNSLLSVHLNELSETQKQLEEVNSKLKLLNDELTETNNKLSESNFIKEEYIGYVFALCSNYISKLDEFRKNINRKIKAKQFDEIKEYTDTPTIAQKELKEFYHNFDAIFLNVYPDFVNDFNSLLQPDERIILKDGELLNTELRIYALVRLGINDSVKIAEFLHCSPQTVYNNRLKTRNKSIVPKDEFAITVRSLGKML